MVVIVVNRKFDCYSLKNNEDSALEEQLLLIKNTMRASLFAIDDIEHVITITRWGNPCFVNKSIWRSLV